MKKEVAAIGLITLFLVVFVPFASSSPDGLEKVVLNYSGQEKPSPWSGLMAGYSVEGIADSYISTVLAGIFGAFMVLLASFLLGRLIENKQATPKNV